MDYSNRSMEIARLLLERETMRTAGELASELGVSAKTVSRELPQVEQLLKENGLKLVKRAGSGLTAEGSREMKAAFINRYAEDTANAEFTPEERRSVIVSQLLRSREPVKLFALASRLGVTDGTVSNDLDKLENWFRQQHLQLMRKPGLGISLSGGEEEIRRAMARYIYDHIDEQGLLKLMQESLEEKGPEERKGASVYLLDLVDRSVIRGLEELVHRMEREMGYQLSDNAHVGLVVHLSLAVQRIRKQEKIQIEKSFLEELRGRREFAMAAQLAAEIEKTFEITVPEEEIGYITMHLLGARNRFQEQTMGSLPAMDNYHLVKLAKSIMRRAARETDAAVESSSGLLAGLVNHLGTSISRMRMHMEIRNPLLEEMKGHYPELMELAAKCVTDLERELGAKLPESEIGYIAMHLGAALADARPFRNVEHRIAVACPTGMGTSRMLASRIRQKYPNLRIVSQLSTLAVTEDYVREQRIDFVVATVPVPHASVPVILVSVLLSAEDCRRIEEELARQNERFFRRAAEEMPKPSFTEALEHLRDYSNAILELARHCFFLEEEMTDIASACRAAGKLAETAPGAGEGIARALLRREEQGNTVVTGHHMVLLHCKSSYVSALSLGILHLGGGFRYPETDGEQIRTAIVLLAPEDCTASELETIGYLSSVLLDRWGLIDLLHGGEEQQIRQELEQIFRGFYHQKYREWMPE